MKTHILTCLVATGLMTSLALAQTSSNSATHATTSASTNTVGGADDLESYTNTVRSGKSTGSSTLQKAQKQEFFQASSLIGKKTQTANGETLGEIKEVVFNQQGEIFAFISLDNGRMAPIPWQIVDTGTAKGKQPVTVKTSKQTLQAAPTITKDQWGGLNNPSFAQGVYSHFQVESPSSASAVGGSESVGSGSSSGSSSRSADVPSTPPTHPDTNSSALNLDQSKDQQ